MNNFKIPPLNQKFELKTFLIVFKKLFWLICLFYIIAIVSSILFCRYTRPVYVASSVVQIKYEYKTSSMIGMTAGALEQGLAPSIELIKSYEFLKTCIEELPLEISYYDIGTFLYFELYKSSPFEVKYIINNTEIFDKKIFINFSSNGKNNCNLSYEFEGKTLNYNISTDKWYSLNGFDIYIVKRPELVAIFEARAKAEKFGKNEYFFTINSPGTILSTISNNLTIQTLSKSAGTVLISLSNHNPVKAAEITNKIAEKFIEFDESQKRQAALNTIEFIDQQLEISANQLNESEKHIHEFRLVNNIKPTDNFLLKNRSTILLSKIENLESRTFSISMEIMTLDKITEMLDNSEESPNIYELLALLSGQQSERFLSTMLSTILRLEEQRDELLFDITKNNHKIIKINTQIESHKSTIIDFIHSTITRLEEQRSEFLRLIKENEEKVFSDSLYDELEYAKLLRIHSIHQDFYSLLIETKAKMLISQAGYVSDNMIFEKASVPNYHEFPSLKKIMGGALVFATMLSFFILALRYLFYNKLHSIDDIREYCDIPIIGGIPATFERMDVSRVLLFDKPKSLLAEAFRNVRTNLDFYPNKDNTKIITVSSTIAGEGKTFVSLNIAAIYAMSDRKTIVLDLDLRKPRIHKSFDVSNKLGISNILIGNNSYQECIQKSGMNNLDFITSGPIPPNPAEIVLTEKYKNLINDLKKEYDIIIIDTPPIGIVSDALASFKISDNSLYILKAGVSPKTFIENIVLFKEKTHINNLGIILNGILKSNLTLGYGYKRRYDYGYLSKKHMDYYGEEFVKEKNIFKRIMGLLKF